MLPAASAVLWCESVCVLPQRRHLQLAHRRLRPGCARARLLLLPMPCCVCVCAFTFVCRPMSPATCLLLAAMLHAHTHAHTFTRMYTPPPPPHTPAGAQWEKAQELFDQMQHKGCKPDSVTFGGLISAYDRAGEKKKVGSGQGVCACVWARSPCPRALRRSPTAPLLPPPLHPPPPTRLPRAPPSPPMQATGAAR